MFGQRGQAGWGSDGGQDHQEGYQVGQDGCKNGHLEVIGTLVF